MGLMLDTIGKLIAVYLQKEVPGYEPFTPSDPERLLDVIGPGDVLLVEGNNRISGIIKYLTQSTWSHAALYVGAIEGASGARRRTACIDRGQYRRRCDVGAAVKILSVPYPSLPPGRLSFEDRTTVCRYAIKPHRLRLRYPKHRRPDALSCPAADSATLAAADDFAGLGRSDKNHLLGADRTGVRRGALSDFAQSDEDAQPAGPARNPAHPRIPRSTCRATSIFLHTSRS